MPGRRAYRPRRKTVRKAELKGGAQTAIANYHTSFAPFGHKMAIAAIGAGEPVRKFGQIIGFAKAAHREGRLGARAQCLHARFRARLSVRRGTRGPKKSCRFNEQATFEGFRRANGRRHAQLSRHPDQRELFASVAGFIATEIERSGILDDYPNVDGVVSFKHGTGCGMAIAAIFDTLKTHAVGLCHQPESGRVLLVGLGCEVFQIGA
jgi:altronate hydrolase